MSRLSAFLNPVNAGETKEIMISNRFIGEDGQPVPFVIRPLKQEENEALVRRCRKYKQLPNGQAQEILDNGELARQIVIAATVDPDFHDAELCAGYGVVDPAQLPGKMLLAGEFAALSRAIMDLSGFHENIGAEAKN